MASESESTQQPDTGRPTEIEDLEQHVDAVHDWVWFDPDERHTVSLVIRDEDGEAVAESYHQCRSYVYALAAVAPEPEDPDEYGLDRPEPPAWVAWENCDEPLDHFATGVRCRDCGEVASTLRQMPDAMSEHAWISVTHRPECPHADRDDKEYWARQHFADWIGDRPDPATMALSCIWDELELLPGIDEAPEPVRQARGERSAAIRAVLVDRLDPDFPDCPECGENALRLIWDWGVECDNCEDADLSDEELERFEGQRYRLWGYRGHGGNARGGEV